MINNHLEEYCNIKNLDFLAYILNSTWGSQFEATGEIMKKRINSGSLFVFAYGLPTEEEKKLYEEVCEIKLKANKEIPLGLLETITLRTEGDYGCVPRYEILTNYGEWSEPVKDADTLIMVDLTVLKTRRGKKGQGEAKKIINFTLEQLAKADAYQYVWTFTPKIEKVQKWHESLGARNTRHIILEARNRFKEPRVCLMDYSQKLRELRTLYLPSTTARQ